MRVLKMKSLVLNPHGLPYQIKAKRWFRIGIISFFTIIIVLTALILWFTIARPIQVLPRIEQAPNFVLTDEQGQWFDSHQLLGQPTILIFSYTRCGLACEPANTRLHEAYTNLQDNGFSVQFVTISFDAAYDSPEVLRNTLKAWPWLTGSAVELKQIIGAQFGIYYSQSETGQFTFDQQAVLIDSKGLIRAFYDAQKLDPAIVLRDIQLINREASSSAAERPLYEAAHLFVCYPR